MNTSLISAHKRYGRCSGRAALSQWLALAECGVPWEGLALEKGRQRAVKVSLSPDGNLITECNGNSRQAHLGDVVKAVLGTEWAVEEQHFPAVPWAPLKLVEYALALPDATRLAAWTKGDHAHLKAFVTAYREANGDPSQLGTDANLKLNWLDRRALALAALRKWAGGPEVTSGGELSRKSLVQLAWGAAPWLFEEHAGQVLEALKPGLGQHLEAIRRDSLALTEQAQQHTTVGDPTTRGLFGDDKPSQFDRSSKAPVRTGRGRDLGPEGEVRSDETPNKKFQRGLPIRSAPTSESITTKPFPRTPGLHIPDTFTPLHMELFSHIIDEPTYKVHWQDGDVETVKATVVEWSGEFGEGEKRKEKGTKAYIIEHWVPVLRFEPFAAAIGLREGQRAVETEFILLPLAGMGRFMMGADPETKDAFEDEKPQGQITFAKPYLMARTTVTQRIWHGIWAAIGKPMPEALRGVGSNEGDGRLPVTMVSWNDCVAWTKEVGLELPSEAQWEYAARAGVQKPWFFGSNPTRLAEYAWFAENSGGHTHPVAELAPNAFGLYDVYGNVWEWCADSYSEHPVQPFPEEKPKPEEKPAAKGGSAKTGGAKKTKKKK